MRAIMIFCIVSSMLVMLPSTDPALPCVQHTHTSLPVRRKITQLFQSKPGDIENTITDCKERSIKFSWSLSIARQNIYNSVVLDQEEKTDHQLTWTIEKIRIKTEYPQNSTPSVKLLLWNTYYTFSCPQSNKSKCQVPGLVNTWDLYVANYDCEYRYWTASCDGHCNCDTCSAFTPCRNKCDPRYTHGYGRPCNLTCDKGKFGVSNMDNDTNCTGICKCTNNEKCNVTNGECVDGKCPTGWQGKKCDTKCSEGSFGDGCSERCRCFNSKHCHFVTGDCSGLCGIRHYGRPACLNTCPKGVFLSNNTCGGVCHCDNLDECNVTSGECGDSGCLYGWGGAKCQNKCHCKSGETCDDEANCVEYCSGGICQEHAHHTVFGNEFVMFVGTTGFLILLIVIIGYSASYRKRKRLMNVNDNVDTTETPGNKTYYSDEDAGGASTNDTSNYLGYVNKQTKWSFIARECNPNESPPSASCESITECLSQANDENGQLNEQSKPVNEETDSSMEK